MRIVRAERPGRGNQQQREGMRPDDLVEWEYKEVCKQGIIGGEEPQVEKALRQLRSLYLTAEPEVPERRGSPRGLDQEELREVLQRVREGGRRHKKEVRRVVMAHSQSRMRWCRPKEKGCLKISRRRCSEVRWAEPHQCADPSGKPP